MARHTPIEDEALAQMLRTPVQRRTGLVRQVRVYRLITPLFGGGVDPATADPLTVVRATEIRGHLRFWWRATRGGQFDGQLPAMRAAEGMLWGAASTVQAARPSQVQTVVEIIERGTLVQQRDRDGQERSLGDPRSEYSYVAFPLTDKPGARVTEAVVFRLTLTFPQDAAAEVAAALWAWETFGGIGARTRRGFGALQCVAIDGEPAELPPADIQGAKAWLCARLHTHVLPGRVPEQVPHLTRDSQLVLTRPRPSADQAWRFLIDQLKAFRQQRPVHDRRPGRNRWPEQDEVRRLTRRRMEPRHAVHLSLVRKFPRAAFGLPLIVQYKRDDQRAGDPHGNNTVNVAGKERFASPLLLRPLACAAGYVGLGLVLDGSRVPSDLTLTTQRATFQVRSDLTSTEAAQIMQSDDRTPLLGDEPDVLTVFLQWIKGR